ncbi:MAG: hypothetical protein JEY94_15065 [Melioribacteraceae bacterium]|nr:hypothetical protein [Melioribacteraceae bacterium]
MHNAFAIDKDKIYLGNSKGSIYITDGNECNKITTSLTKLNNFYGYYDEVIDDYNFLFADTKNLYKMNLDESYHQENFIENEPIVGIWTNKGFPLFITGLGVFVNNNHSWKRVKNLPEYSFSKIEGNGLNNIVAVDWNGVIMHFNGLNWDINSRYERTGLLMRAISFNQGILGICGRKGNNAFVLIGTQMN